MKRRYISPKSKVVCVEFDDIMDLSVPKDNTPISGGTQEGDFDDSSKSKGFDSWE